MKVNELSYYFMYTEDLNSLKDIVKFSCSGYKSKVESDIIPRQHPDELLRLMEYCKDKRIRKYLEIGVEFGGTLILLDAYFRSIESCYLGSTGIDIRLDLNNSDKNVINNTYRRTKRYLKYDIMAIEIFKEYNRINPSCDFQLISAEDYVVEPYDLVFIDTNQKYNQLVDVFFKYSECSRYIAIHDIKDNRWGNKRLWEELQWKYQCIDLSVDIKSAGLGLIII